MIILPLKYLSIFYCFASKCCKHSLLCAFWIALDQIMCFFNWSFIFYSETIFLQSSFGMGRWTFLIKVFNEWEFKWLLLLSTIVNWCLLSRLIVHKYHQNKKFLITFKTSLIIRIHCLAKRNTQCRTKQQNTSSQKKQIFTVSFCSFFRSIFWQESMFVCLFILSSSSFFAFCVHIHQNSKAKPYNF